MPLLSKARFLNQNGDAIKEFSYQAGDSPSPGDGVALGDLPPGTEFLWPAPSEGEPLTGGERKFTEDEVNAREQTAWQKGFEQAAAQGRESLEKAIATERASLASALREFASGREAYYQRMEGEVVRLVLSIALKILHRESQLDPMLLTGVVRVALEKMAGGTTVRLRVPVIQADSWRAAVRSIPARELTIEVVADESLTGPRCLVVTEMGTTDVSLEAQLGEIERGFLDLLTQRPGTGSRADIQSV